MKAINRTINEVFTLKELVKARTDEMNDKIELIRAHAEKHGIREFKTSRGIVKVCDLDQAIVIDDKKVVDEVSTGDLLKVISISASKLAKVLGDRAKDFIESHTNRFYSVKFYPVKK